MKLKLVVASMSILGLISCPVLAGNYKNKTHHKVVKQQAATHDYKDYKDMAPPADICMVSATSMTMDEMSQNMGRALPNPCNPGWFNRIAVSGGVNVDFGKFGNQNANFMGVNYQVFSLNDAYLNFSAVVSDWAKAFASISYNTATINDPSDGIIPGTDVFPTAEYSAAYSNNVVSGGTNTLQLEQAYATFGNFDCTPFFLQVGKQFIDYSRYEIHPITRSLTQVLSETLSTAGEIGFVANGFNGSFSIFDDPLSKVGKTSPTTNYVLALGYDQPSDQLGWDIGGAYQYNMIGVNDVAYVVNQWNTKVAGNTGGYNRRVAATAWYGDINSGPFTLGARYTTALGRFSILDAPENALARNATGALTSTSGAKPWAAGLQAGYGFDAWNHGHNLYAGYQLSRDGAALLLPKDRFVLGYAGDWFGHGTTVGIEWDHDRDYSTSDGGSGNNYNLVTLRFGAKFA